MTRKQYRQAWAREEYARRRAEGQCVRCPNRTKRSLCVSCRKMDNALRLLKRRA